MHQTMQQNGGTVFAVENIDVCFVIFIHDVLVLPVCVQGLLKRFDILAVSDFFRKTVPNASYSNTEAVLSNLCSGSYYW